MIAGRWNAVLLALLAIGLTVAACLVPRIPQPLSYHQFADQRAWLGVPNYGDVVSNLAFLIAGIWGLIVAAKQSIAAVFIEPAERWPYVTLFAGLILTAAGSSYYHLAPDNSRLVWDRLPMTMVFMSLVAAIVMERVNVRAGLILLPVLLLAGIASVIQWHLSELRGAGDLRFYGAVQMYAVLVVLLALFMQPRYTRTYDLAIMGAFYVAAKAFELADRAVFSAGHIVSGHTLKHIAAAGAGFWIVRMLTKRRAVADGGS